MSATIRTRAAWFVSLSLASGLIGLARAQDPGDDPPPPPQPPGQEVQTRGPVHESFAQPVVYDPRPGPVIPKAPPQPIEEMPPEQKPEGANVQWIPGYWAWDDARRDYLWISGVWRNVPPGRQWNPGYWHQAEGGFQWAPGAWTPAQAEQAQYYPAPPTTLEAGPSSPMPVAGSIWSPGCWIWVEGRYAWRPGFWVAPQPNWVWMPAQYVWTPGGYLFVEGYWDRPFATRGMLFAPVYFSQPVYLQPAYVYQPTITIAVGGLMASLFVRPSYGVYYFGDYYAASYASVGIYPWFSFTETRYGYDPMFAYYSVTYARTNPRWVVEQREAFVYRREHIEARPPHNYAAMARAAEFRHSFATPIDRLAATHPAAFARIEANEQRRLVAHAEQVQRFQQERARREVAIRERAAAMPDRPHAAEHPRSPVVAHPPNVAQAHAAAAHHTPPAMPAHPALDHAARPMPAHLPPHEAARPLPHALPPHAPAAPRHAAQPAHEPHRRR